MTPHCFAHRVVVGKPVCCVCGLMFLRNDLTEWCVKRGCDYADAPGFKNAVATLPERFRQRKEKAS